MPSLSDPGNTAFEGSATYRILVQGSLSETSRRRFADMTVESDPADTDRPRTILIRRGQVRDQAELRGVLDALYGLRLPEKTTLRGGCSNRLGQPTTASRAYGAAASVYAVPCT